MPLICTEFDREKNYRFFGFATVSLDNREYVDNDGDYDDDADDDAND